MFSRIIGSLRVLAETPPFHLVVSKLLKLLPASAETRVRWNIGPRPHYLLGVLKASQQALAEKVSRISVIELGVAGGWGLRYLEQCAREVERETHVIIDVFGFDNGTGLPEFCGDFRDHPDYWRPQDYPMDVGALRRTLAKRTTLVLGNVAQTIPDFVAKGSFAPIGFIAFDMDLYSSTRDALQLFSLPRRKTLRRTFLYFDDVAYDFNHRFAGELLAIEEFNSQNDDIKIDRWRGVTQYSAYYRSSWLEKMYIAHNLELISQANLSRAADEVHHQL